MKRIIIILIALIFIKNINGQEKESKNKRDKHIFSFRFGYSIPVAKSQIGSPRSEIGDTYKELKSNNIFVSETNSYGSRGAGLNFALSYEYMITENISAGLEFSYLYTLGINDAFTLIKSGNNIVYDANQNSYTSMLRATPMVGIYANKGLLIRPYAKFGLIVPLTGTTNATLIIVDETGKVFNDLMPIIDPEFFNNIKNNIITRNLDVPTSTIIEATTSGVFSVGFDARIGAEYKILDNLKIFAELNMQMLTVKGGKTTITKFESSTNDEIKGFAPLIGIDVKDYTLDDVPEYLRVTKYVDEINEESNVYGTASYNREKSADQLGFRDNYNAFGFILGIKYGF
tara:strand:- start:559 stop:1590 length:1032 start_codon:yes stop_codon:yes gene_type:complete